MGRNNSSSWGKGRQQGQKGNIFENVINSTLGGVTGHMFGSREQKKYDAGYQRGVRDRAQSKKRW